MSKFFYLAVIIFLLVCSFYLLTPSPAVPPPPPDSLVSNEPADTETVYRSAYFTNLSRVEVMAYYKQNFPHLLALNHPPEDSASLIRDQTRSSWLEELHNIGKDTLYINGFYPTKPTEEINRNGQKYAAKITVRYVPSGTASRLTTLILVSLCLVVIYKEYTHV